jgi:hypothetical protein
MPTSINPIRPLDPFEKGLPAHSARTQAGEAETGPLGEQRRRSRRVPLRIRAKLNLVSQGEEWTFEGVTENVSAHGAMVVMPKSLPAQTHLVLENCHTRERIACRVMRMPRETSDGFRIALSFDCPAPNFWKIAFPPSDWHADEL